VEANVVKEPYGFNPKILFLDRPIRETNVMLQEKKKKNYVGSETTPYID